MNHNYPPKKISPSYILRSFGSGNQSLYSYKPLFSEPKVKVYYDSYFDHYIYLRNDMGTYMF